MSACIAVIALHCRLSNVVVVLYSTENHMSVISNTGEHMYGMPLLFNCYAGSRPTPLT